MRQNKEQVDLNLKKITKCENKKDEIHMSKLQNLNQMIYNLHLIKT